MTSQMKQRIVGVIVLLFLAAIILPWLFGENHSAVFEEKKLKEKEKLSSIDVPEVVKENSEVTKPIPDKLDAVNEPNNVANTDNNEIGNTVFADNSREIKNKTQTPNSSKINNIQNTIINSHPRNESSKKRPQREVETELNQPNFSKIKITNKTPVKAVTKANVSKSWTIQLGTFSSKVNADKLMNELKAKGYVASKKISKNTAGKEITRVYVGQFTDRSSAVSATNKIAKSVKVHGVVVKANV